MRASATAASAACCSRTPTTASSASPSDSVVGLVSFDDAGVSMQPRWTSAAPALNTTLATAGGWAFAGSTQFVASAIDGGLIMSPGWLDDAGVPLRVQERMNLMTRDRA